MNLPTQMVNLYSSHVFSITFHRQMIVFSPLKLTIKCTVVIQRFRVKAFRWSFISLLLASILCRTWPICQLFTIPTCLKRLNAVLGHSCGWDYVRHASLFWISLGRLTKQSQLLLPSWCKLSFPVSCVLAIQRTRIWHPLKESYFCGIGSLVSICIGYKNSCTRGMVHAWVGQKLLKNYICKSFPMSRSWTPDTVPTSTNAIQQPILHKLFCHGNPPNKLYTYLY